MICLCLSWRCNAASLRSTKQCWLGCRSLIKYNYVSIFKTRSVSLRPTWTGSCACCMHRATAAEEQKEKGESEGSNQAEGQVVASRWPSPRSKTCAQRLWTSRLHQSSRRQDAVMNVGTLELGYSRMSQSPRVSHRCRESRSFSIAKMMLQKSSL